MEYTVCVCTAVTRKSGAPAGASPAAVIGVYVEQHQQSHDVEIFI